MEVWQRGLRSKRIYQQKSYMSGIVKRRMQWSERDFHILWLAKEGRSPREIAELLGYTARWVRTIIQRWNTQGAEGIRDRRHDIVGGPALLSREQQEELRAALREPPADAGLWSGPKVAQWMQER
jgi:transposase